MRAALNTIWKAKRTGTLSRLLRARLASLGLVATLGFLLIVSQRMAARKQRLTLLVAIMTHLYAARRKRPSRQDQEHL